MPSTDEVLTIDCDECVMQHTHACDDCVVTFLCTPPTTEQAVVVDVAEVRALRLLADTGSGPAAAPAPPHRLSRGPAVGDRVLSRAYADELLAVGPAGRARPGRRRLGRAVRPTPAGRSTERAAAGLAATMAVHLPQPGPRPPTRRPPWPGWPSLVVGARRYGRRPHRRRRPTRRCRPGWPATPASRPLRAPCAGRSAQVADRLRADGWQARVLVDDNALVDRAAAHRAGLGWFGKNANVLVPGPGQLVRARLGAHRRARCRRPTDPVPDGCGACRRCLDGCPTGAIVAPGVVDARRCLAWLVQAEGVFPVEHRVALGDRLYGCDDCQEVCPPSRAAPRAVDPPVDRPATSGRRRAGERRATGSTWSTCWPPTTPPCSAAFGRWYIPGASRATCAATPWSCSATSGAAGDPSRARPRWLGALADADPLLRAHAVWAARRLGRADLLAAVARRPRPAGAGRAATAPTCGAAPRSRRSTAVTPPAGHQRLPAQDRRHPVLPVGAVAPAAARRRRPC